MKITKKQLQKIIQKTLTESYQEETDDASVVSREIWLLVDAVTSYYAYIDETKLFQKLMQTIQEEIK